MALYWRLSSVPELEGVPADARELVWKMAKHRAARETYIGRLFLSEWCQWIVSAIGAGLAVYMVKEVFPEDWLGSLEDTLLERLANLGWAMILIATYGSVIGAWLMIERAIAVKLSRQFIREILTAGG